MNVLVGLQFQDGKTSFLRASQHVNHGSIGSGKCRHLGVDMSGIKARIESRHVLEDQRLQPSFGVHAPEWVAAVAPGGACPDNRCDEFTKCRLGLFREPGFISRRAKTHFFLNAKRSRRICRLYTGKLKPMPAEPNL